MILNFDEFKNVLGCYIFCDNYERFEQRIKGVLVSEAKGDSVESERKRVDTLGGGIRRYFFGCYPGHRPSAGRVSWGKDLCSSYIP